MNVNDLLRSKAGQNPENRKRLEEAKRALGGVGTVRVVGPVQDSKRQSYAIPALDPRAQVHPASKRGVVIVAQIISCRHTEVDSDNLIIGAKPLRDAIAHSLGVDDRDRRIKWEYRQCIGEGPEGTIVKINTIK